MISDLIESIAHFFKPTIGRILVKKWKKGARNLHINLYLNNQVLFQVIPSKHFIERGIKTSSENDMTIIHFFNKNKTITFDKLNKFKSRISENGFIEFETEKNLNFIRNIGNNPKIIEKEIFNDIELYGLRDYEKNRIKIEFLDYKK